ncbi:AAA family ATPase [Hephaestia mangrovi]|uniref:AAA family ATPase n=1 Tax=Hephaestia mangrovi TaxID=2873268 RepID=UPI001CA7A762|nr:AAA family ATPase [Hephaestia mangrovi]MBY8828940.1 ATP-binding protein [Hephaestia mangrovi]
MPAETVDPYRVIFTRELDPITFPEPSTIVISPNDNRETDDGYRIRVDIVITPPVSTDLEPNFRAGAFLGFHGKTRRHGDVRDLLDAMDEAAGDTITADDMPDYFTILPDMQAYRKIISALGPHEGSRALRAMKDMVEAGAGATGGWLREAKGRKVFSRGFLRQSETYFAWKNAETILDGEEFEETGALSEELHIQFHLKGRPNPHDLRFSFKQHEPVLPKRFAIVIGKNGVGKSQVLSRIARSALRSTGELTDGDGGRPQLNRLLAFYPTQSGSSVFPAHRRGERVWYRRMSLTHAGIGRGRQTASDLIVQLARTDERIAGIPRIELFLGAIRAIDIYDELVLGFGRSGRDGIRLSELGNLRGEELLDVFSLIDEREEPKRLTGDEAFPLSSGELAFVRFAAMASLYIENSSLLLFDEPETHLHPNFISQFVALLDSLLKQTGSAAIIATHSAYFVREAFEDQVRVLRSDKDRWISTEIPRLRTFGADVGSISYFVFGEDEPSRLAQQVEERIASTKLPWRQIFAEYKDELSLDLLGEIRAKVEEEN